MAIRIFAPMLFLVLAASGQGLSVNEEKVFLTALEADENALRKCEQTTREEQIREFGKPLPRISHMCFGGCPRNIPKPVYPIVARKNKIAGIVVASVWVDLNGEVVKVSAVTGPKFFRMATIEAAYRSTFTPLTTCENRTVRFRRTIRFQFRPDQ